MEIFTYLKVLGKIFKNFTLTYKKFILNPITKIFKICYEKLYLLVDCPKKLNDKLKQSNFNCSKKLVLKYIRQRMQIF